MATFSRSHQHRSRLTTTSRIALGCCAIVGVFLCGLVLWISSSHHWPSSSSSLRLQSPVISDADQTDNNNKSDSFDIVTLVHHDDLTVFLHYGLASWQRYFTRPDSRIFIVGTPLAVTKLQKLKQQGRTKPTSSTTIDWESIFLISQDEYPFTLDDVKKVARLEHQTKPTWTYQQLLKLYAFEVLSQQSSPIMSTRPTLQPHFLVIDSDNVAIRQHDFMIHGKPVYNIASAASGAFPEDCDVGRNVVQEVFGGKIHAAFDDNEDEEEGARRFTSVTHHMMMNGGILRDFLARIEDDHAEDDHQRKPAWHVLSTLQVYLSEYELYMAWMMTYHRDALYVRQTPYMNSGRSDAPYLYWLQYRHDIVYLTKHDDWDDIDVRCCVNSEWPRDDAESDPAMLTCRCCKGDENEACIHATPESSKITCDSLGIAGCQHDDQGRMFFQALSSSEESEEHSGESEDSEESSGENEDSGESEDREEDNEEDSVEEE